MNVVRKSQASSVAVGHPSLLSANSSPSSIFSPPPSASLESLKDFQGQSLCLSNRGLRSLSSLPPLPQLKALDLSGNEIVDGLDYLSPFTGLVRLNLARNNIQSILQIFKLETLPGLTDLNLERCRVMNIPDFVDTMFDLLPRLSVLNGIPKTSHFPDSPVDTPMQDANQSSSPNSAQQSFQSQPQSFSEPTIESLPLAISNSSSTKQSQVRTASASQQDGTWTNSANSTALNGTQSLPQNQNTSSLKRKRSPPPPPPQHFKLFYDYGNPIPVFRDNLTKHQQAERHGSQPPDDSLYQDNALVGDLEGPPLKKTKLNPTLVSFPANLPSIENIDYDDENDDDDVYDGEDGVNEETEKSGTQFVQRSNKSTTVPGLHPRHKFSGMDEDADDEGSAGFSHEEEEAEDDDDDDDYEDEMIVDEELHLQREQEMSIEELRRKYAK